MDQTEQAKGRPTNRSRPLQRNENQPLVSYPSEVHTSGKITIIHQLEHDSTRADDGAGTGSYGEVIAHHKGVSKDTKIIDIQTVQVNTSIEHKSHASI